MDIQVLGPGCPKCREVEKLVRTVAAELGADVTVVKVEDFQEIARMGVFATPAVAVDGEVKCVGKVPSKAEIAGWING
ncbi:thioredoxin family protein [Fundidesulfovibrio soli]|uniref:thioredoxin family protein n=1 Tax=Fundidesulfovibrio soli TaxID=2922716 RepID=UPI001FAEE179|nr:thioredoxin family protein [Fundidesulfovibrio soli]